MQQLSAQDASFLYSETPTAPMTGSSLTIYDPSSAPGGKVTFKQLLAHIERRLHLAGAFRQRVVEVPFNADHPWWVDDENFDLEFHVRHIALPEPGDWRQLCIQCARLISRPLDRNKPLWEFYVIDGLDRVDGYPPGCFGILAKIHHACIDGASGTELSIAIHDLAPDVPETPPPPEPWKAEPPPNPQELLARAAWNNATQPLRMLETLAKSAMSNRRVSQLMQRPGAVPTASPPPRTRFNAPVAPHRVVDGVQFDFADVRRLRSLVPGSTVNDVVLALVGGALRQYLMDKNELPEDSLTAMCPIAVRDEASAGGGAGGAGSGGIGGNQVAGMFVPLHTDIADAARRLAAVHDSTKAAKELTNAIGARTMTDLTKMIPAATAALAGRLAASMAIANEQAAPPYNTVVTNVPGPQQPLYMAGARAVAMYGFGMVHDNMGLMNVVTSYCGDIGVSFTADRAMLPDPAFYAECLRDSFKDLQLAAR